MAAVADLIEVVAVATRALAEVLDWIGGRRAPVGAQTVLRLETLLVRLREGVRVRSQLATLTPQLLAGGGVLWTRSRHHARAHAHAPAPAPQPASAAPAPRPTTGTATATATAAATATATASRP